MKRVALGTAVVAAAVLAVAFIVRRGGSQQETYRFVTVKRGDVAATVSATGTLNPVRTVQVGTQVSGQISALYADFNSHVKKGQLIAQLDTTLLRQAVTEAQANAEKAKADLAQSEFLLAQSDSLFRRKVVTESDYRSALHAWRVADAANVSAQAALERARRNLGYANIYAPIDGIVIERSVQVGQTVAANFSAPQLFLIAQDLRNMRILAKVDESDIGQIRTGEPVSFTVEAYPDTAFRGTVSQVRLQDTIQSNVVDYTVVIDVSNQSRKLLPGMTATTTFLVNQADNVLEVPDAAIRFRPSQQMMAEVGGGAPGRDSAGGRGGRGGTVGGPPGGLPGGRKGGPPGAVRRAGSVDDPASGFGAPSGGSPWATAAGNQSAMLWTVDGSGGLHVTRVKTGLTDGEMTQISGPGVRAGMKVVAGVTSADQSQQGSGPFGGRRGGFRFGF